MLHAKDIHAAYGEVPVLTGVSLSVQSGETLALLGRNGVGKTTLMRSLIGLLRPTSGSISLDGEEIAGLPSNRIARRGVAFVPQGRGIFAKLSVRENLLVGTRAGGRAAEIPEEVFTYFPVLKERLTQAGGTLSGGQQQQLAIARAFCGKPKVLLLDEPSEGIQPNIVQDIGTIVRDIVKESGIATLLVEQNLDLARHMADRCAVMEKGQIVYEGDAEDLHDEALLTGYLAL